MEKLKSSSSIVDFGMGYVEKRRVDEKKERAKKKKRRETRRETLRETTVAFWPGSGRTISFQLVQCRYRYNSPHLTCPALPPPLPADTADRHRAGYHFFGCWRRDHYLRPCIYEAVGRKETRLSLLLSLFSVSSLLVLLLPPSLSSPLFLPASLSLASHLSIVITFVRDLLHINS